MNVLCNQLVHDFQVFFKAVYAHQLLVFTLTVFICLILKAGKQRQIDPCLKNWHHHPDTFRRREVALKQCSLSPIAKKLTPERRRVWRQAGFSPQVSAIGA